MRKNSTLKMSVQKSNGSLDSLHCEVATLLVALLRVICCVHKSTGKYDS